MQAPVLAIDFGTSNCSAAWLDELGRVHVAAIKDGVSLLPSVAWYGPTGHVLVGQPAHQQMVSDPKNTIFGIKRFMGMKWSSPFVHRHKDRYAFDLMQAAEGTVGVHIGGQVKPLEDIAVDILKRLVELARISAGVNFTDGLVTVPAHFGYAQRMAIRRSAARAGLDVKGMVNEPTAAAMYYARKKGNDGTVLVFDLGGGTFDATLMAIVSGVVKVLATGGDAFLGGADFDARIVDHMLRKFHEEHNIDLRLDTAATQRLLIAAETCKIELSRSEEARIRISAIAAKGERFLDLELRLTRKELEELTATLVEKCVGSCEDVLKRAKIGALEVDEIVFVGGMTRMPLIRRRLADIFVANPAKNVHPDLGVVVGAALLTQGDHSLIDATSLAIGVSLPGGHNRELVPVNTPVPSVRRVTLTENERPPPGQVLAFGVYEAVGFTSLERDLLGAVRVPPEWLAQNPGQLVIEAWLGSDLDLTLFLHSAEGTRLQLPLTTAEPKTAPPPKEKTPKHPWFRSVALETPSPSSTSSAPTKTTGSADESPLDDEASAPKLGDVVCGYHLIDIIGAGGMGRVYLAEHAKLGRRVALKMLRRTARTDAAAFESFLTEARAVNQICHENIIEVTDLFETDDGRACYIMEVLEGRSLAELLRSVGGLRLERTVKIAFQIASALVAVHDAHIIHRELKPENIFLTAKGTRDDFVKLLDFGVAKLIDGEGQSMNDTKPRGAQRLTATRALSQPGSIAACTVGESPTLTRAADASPGGKQEQRIGTLDYMSPEQAVGHAVDHRADIYALGVVLYEMTTGQRPYQGSTDRALLFLQLEKPPPPPSEIMRSKHPIPKELDALILDCLARDLDLRPQTMREVKGRLEAVAEMFQAPARLEVPSATPVRTQGPATLMPNGQPVAQPSVETGVTLDAPPRAQVPASSVPVAAAHPPSMVLRPGGEPSAGPSTPRNIEETPKVRRTPAHRMTRLVITMVAIAGIMLVIALGVGRIFFP